ncbi:MAG: hypothetical protein KAS18_09095, partial [Calditrichia bacterium]|nr:hypothetical protein [Calditrichia bacterium]
MKYFLYNIHTIFKRLSFFSLMLFLLFSSKESLAQLSGSYTIGSGGTYSTFAAAAADLNSQGVSGAVTFNIFSGTYTEQFVIGNITGTSASETIVFQAQSGNAADVDVQFTASSTGDNYIARLNGTDFITFQNM